VRLGEEARCGGLMKAVLSGLLKGMVEAEEAWGRW